MVDNIEQPETDEPLESGLYWAAKDKIQRKVNFSNATKLEIRILNCISQLLLKFKPGKALTAYRLWLMGKRPRVSVFTSCTLGQLVKFLAKLFQIQVFVLMVPSADILTVYFCKKRRC